MVTKSMGKKVQLGNPLGAAPFSNMAVEHPHDDELPEIDD
jgi:hypothetical protein